MQHASPLFNVVSKLLPRIQKDEKGGVAVLIALALTVLIGFGALGTEVARWYMTKRTMQSAADAAASAAAADLAANSSATSTQLTSDGYAVAAQFSFINGSGGTEVIVNNPPGSGPYSGNSLYVQVSITQPQTPLLTALFLSTGPTIAASATAKANRQASDSGCVLALSGANIVDTQLNGNVNLSAPGCAFYDNSPLQNGSLTMGNNTSLTASAVYTVGSPNQTTGITTTDGIFTGSNPTADPYATVPLPTPSSCNSNQKLQNPSNTTFTATGSPATYVFCKDVSQDQNGGSPVLTFNPGIYIFACGASLSFNNGTINGTGGVTFVFERNCPNGNASSFPGAISVSAGANLNLTAPTSGPTAGIAIFQDRSTCPQSNGSSSCTNTLGGTGTFNVTGAIYLPNNPVIYSGGSGAGGASQCTQLIANTITFNGGATFNNNCAGTGTQTISLTNGQLVL